MKTLKTGIMHPQYNKPPLFQVTCEVIFATNKDWDPFFFSDFYEKIKDVFPHRNMIQEFVFSNVNERVNAEPVLEKHTNMQCMNEEKNLVLTFKENFLGITVVPPYKGWSYFKNKIAYAMNAYKEVVNPVIVSRAVLKYRNKVQVGEEHSYKNLQNSFVTKPSLDHLNSNEDRLRAVQMVLEFYSSDKKSILSMQQHTLKLENDSAPVLFDLGYLCVDAVSLIREEIFEEWLEEANEAIHQAFQDSLTESIKQTFK